MWACVACGATQEGPRQPPPCLCGVEGSWLDEASSGALALAARRHGRAVLAADVAVGELERLATGELAIDALLGGGFAFGQSVLVWGAPGGGKSRLTARWASARERALFVSLEMPLGITRDTAASAGAHMGRLYLLDGESDWQSEARRLRVRVVVYDSITEAPDATRAALELSRWAYRTGGLAFGICQRNSRGRAHGGPRFEHRADTTISVRPLGGSDARVRVLKSRFCARGATRVSLLGG